MRLEAKEGDDGGKVELEDEGYDVLEEGHEDGTEVEEDGVAVGAVTDEEGEGGEGEELVFAHIG